MDKTAKERMKRYRQRNKGVTEKGEDVTVSVTERVKDVTPDVTPDVTQEHPVMKYLIPGEKRTKMEKVVESLKNHKQLHNVRLGAGVHSIPLDVVGELLDATV